MCFCWHHYRFCFMPWRIRFAGEWNRCWILSLFSNNFVHPDDSHGSSFMPSVSIWRMPSTCFTDGFIREKKYWLTLCCLPSQSCIPWIFTVCKHLISGISKEGITRINIIKSAKFNWFDIPLNSFKLKSIEIDLADDGMHSGPKTQIEVSKYIISLIKEKYEKH